MHVSIRKWCRKPAGFHSSCVLHHRVTQSSRSWLPVLEKHDIPIVVGVGVSLAFIFITVSFYSVVQKNEPAPTSRAGKTSSATSKARRPTVYHILKIYPKKILNTLTCMFYPNSLGIYMIIDHWGFICQFYYGTESLICQMLICIMGNRLLMVLIKRRATMRTE